MSCNVSYNSKRGVFVFGVGTGLDRRVSESEWFPSIDTLNNWLCPLMCGRGFCHWSPEAVSSYIAACRPRKNDDLPNLFDKLVLARYKNGVNTMLTDSAVDTDKWVYQMLVKGAMGFYVEKLA